MEAKSLKELQDVVVAHLARADIFESAPLPPDVVRAFHERLLRIETMLQSASRKISTNQVQSTRIEAMLDEAKKDRKDDGND
jgi:hypothetical protein